MLSPRLPAPQVHGQRRRQRVRRAVPELHLVGDLYGERRQHHAVNQDGAGGACTAPSGLAPGRGQSEQPEGCQAMPDKPPRLPRLQGPDVIFSMGGNSSYDINYTQLPPGDVSCYLRLTIFDQYNSQNSTSIAFMVGRQEVEVVAQRRVRV